jgi:Transposase, Mutator family
VSRWPSDYRVELEAFWRSHHEAWRRSDLNQREYCEAHGLPLKRFGNWRAKFKQEPDAPQKLLYRRGGELRHMSKWARHMSNEVGPPKPDPATTVAGRRTFSEAEKALTAVIQEAYIQGISTRSVDDLVKAMGMSGISKSQVSRLCEEIDQRVKAFLDRPIEGDWPTCGSTPPT